MKKILTIVLLVFGFGIMAEGQVLEAIHAYKVKNTDKPSDKEVTIQTESEEIKGVMTFSEEEEDAGDTDIGAETGFTFSSARTIPAITIIGSTLIRKDDNKKSNPKQGLNSAADLILFGGQKINDQDTSLNAITYLFREASEWGAGIDITMFLNYSKKRNEFASVIPALYLGLNYAGRNIERTEADERISVYPDALLWKVEAEVAFFGNASFFMAVNGNNTLNAQEEFKDYFETNTTSFRYVTFGVRGKFTLNYTKGEVDDSEPSVNLEFGFIPINGALEGFLDRGSDRVVPTIRVGYKSPIFTSIGKGK